MSVSCEADNSLPYERDHPSVGCGGRRIWYLSCGIQVVLDGCRSVKAAPTIEIIAQTGRGQVSPLDWIIPQFSIACTRRRLFAVLACSSPTSARISVYSKSPEKGMGSVLVVS